MPAHSPTFFLAYYLICKHTCSLTNDIPPSVFPRSDLRLGIQAQTVAKDFEKVFQVTDSLYVGLAGLATDVLTVKQVLKMRCNLYELREQRQVKPESFSALLSTLLYEKRFGPYFIEPIVAGLREDNTPFLSGGSFSRIPFV